jgi:hypothetical protein
VAALLEAGKLLVSKRDRSQHGEWYKWLDTNADVLKFSRKTACRLATIASNLPLREIWTSGTPRGLVG